MKLFFIPCIFLFVWSHFFNKLRTRVLYDELNDRKLVVSLPMIRSHCARRYPYVKAFLRTSYNSHLPLLSSLSRENA